MIKIERNTKILVSHINKDTWTSHEQSLVDVNENNVYK